MKTFKKNQIIITALAIMIAVAGYINFTDRASLDEGNDVFNNVSVADLDGMNNDAEGTLVPNIENNDGLVGEVIVDEAAILEENANSNSVSNLEGSVDASIESNPETNLTTNEGETNILVEETMADSNGEDIVGEAILVSSTSVESAFFLESKIKREQTRAYSVELLVEMMNNENLGEEQKVEAANQMIDLQERIEMEAAAESILEAKGFTNVFVRVDETDVDVVVSADALTDAELAQIYDVVSRKTGFEAESITITPLQISN
jgi:stage III sporulation protein AH